ncbi:MAG: DUF4191 domain-containing protein [Paeniglutamicibacter terrestris]|jgi:hypothetical protein|uniref:DUF4191 domain-containing protein n=1 Tax=Paeniglutamicibacter terrestris TaxID=2723403 RepID=A0ABX1G884_9MICC|nr:DUF4191 domain-containing protein [Paeniglutamicibacter terrestris]ASN38943.1 hypothetical protein CGQ24_07920 [Arthrobacter sp. 7749]NKG22468.1 DUF4191 domain-containing protein [Paeniglutamicibacter terrestris]
MAKNTDNASSEAASPKRGLFSRKPKAEKANKEPGRLKQLGQVFQMTRKNDPMVVWLMLLAALGVLVVGLIIGLIINNWVTTLLIAIPVALLAATMILSRRAEKAAFTQLEGRPGAAGAAMSVLRRGWILKEEPVAVNPRSKDLVFMGIGRAGVVLVTEGPTARVRSLVDAERRRMGRVLPNVPIHVIHSGNDEGQTKLAEVGKAMKKLPKSITKLEISAVDKRLSTLGSAKLPIPKGIDPNRARPNRKQMR